MLTAGRPPVPACRQKASSSSRGPLLINRETSPPSFCIPTASGMSYTARASFSPKVESLAWYTPYGGSN